MNIKLGVRDVLWMAVGAGLFLIVLLVALHLQKRHSPAEQVASKAERLELVLRMQVGLASASEAEKSAVLAVTDEDSKKFADQARDATAEVSRQRAELAGRLAAEGNQEERDLLAQFTDAFGDLQRIDKELLDLSTRNTNLKASALTFGPAMTSLKEMDSALSHLPADDVKVAHWADNARLAAWRLMAMIPPHIAEESNQKMDQMESQMAKEERTVLESLDTLAAMPMLADNADLKSAVADYASFRDTKGEILKLSRENTNVLSLSISLNQKRKAMLVGQASLASLQRAIQAEPIAGVSYGNVKPR